MMLSSQSLVWVLLLQTVQGQKPTTIFNQSDVASVVALSPTILGDLVIATSAAQSIALDGIELIKGSLICDNASNLTNLSSNSISRIGASMTLRNLTELSTLSFPQLEFIGAIDWYGLFSLEEPDFTSGVNSVASMTVGNSFLAGLGNVQMSFSARLKIYQNHRLQVISMEMEVVSNLSVYDNDNLTTIRLGNPRYAENINLRGNFTEISGFGSMSSIANLTLVTDSPFNCTYFNRYTEGNFQCLSSNSGFRRNNPNQPSPNLSAGPTSTEAKSTSTTSSSNATSSSASLPEGPTKSKGLSTIAITFIILAPLLSFAILSYLCFRNYRTRKERKRKASEGPGIPELSSGGYHENAELEALEKPGELADFAYPEIIPIELPETPFAHIIDVSEIDEHRNLEGRGEHDHLLVNERENALSGDNVKVDNQTLNTR